MKNIILKLITIGLLIIYFFQSCQYENKIIQKNKSYYKVLIDSISEINFLLDTSQIYITAINFKNDTLWRTDPWKDNGLPYYRFPKPYRPTIWVFEFQNNEYTQNKEMIRIGYNNSQFGNIDKLTGKFDWIGQD